MQERIVSLIKSARKEGTWKRILQGVLDGKELVVLEQNLCGRSSYALDPASSAIGDVVMLLEDYQALPAIIEMGSLVTPHLNFSHIEYVLDCREFEVVMILQNKTHCESLLALLG